MTLTRAGALMAAAALALSLAPAPSAEASAKHFRTVFTEFNAELQLCKVSVDDGARFRIYGRLDNTASEPKDKRLGAAYVLRNGERTGHYFKTGWVAGGTISGTKTFLVKNSPTRTLELGISMPTGAFGHVFNLTDVHNC